MRLFGLHPSGEHASVYTEDELRHLVEVSRKSGYLEEEELKLINRVFDFSDAEVREAMIPRINVAALPVTATLEEAKQAFRTQGYSRLPVYRGNLDKIAGVLVRRELEPYLEGKPEAEFKLEELLYPPLFIPATSRLGTTLKQMQSARSHQAFVIDEHGGLEGIVTLEDLLEEIVGEISDEYDEEGASQIQEIDGGYLLDGMLAVRDANRRLSLDLPESENYMTIAGFLLAQAGRLVGHGEVIEYEGALFTVESTKGHRILRVRYTPARQAAEGIGDTSQSAV